MTARLSDTPMTDVMVDIETTGTNPQFGAIIQLAAVKFNYETGDIGGTFNRSLAMAPNRFWDDGTRRWWQQQKRAILDGIIARMEDPGLVIRDYHAFICQEGRPVRFWSRGSFDYYFMTSYMEQYGLQMPHRYSDARDLRSYIAGRWGYPTEPDLSWLKGTVQGDAHNALFDCVVQLKQLFAARDRQWGEVLPPITEGATA